MVMTVSGAVAVAAGVAVVDDDAADDGLQPAGHSHRAVRLRAGTIEHLRSTLKVYPLKLSKYRPSVAMDCVEGTNSAQPGAFPAVLTTLASRNISFYCRSLTFHRRDYSSRVPALLLSQQDGVVRSEHQKYSCPF